MSSVHPAALDVPGTGHLPLNPGRSVTVEVRPSISARAEELFGHTRGLIRRAYIEGYPDTHFSVPARVSIAGRKIAGYVTVETAEGFSTPSADDPLIYRFVPYLYGANVKGA